MCALPSPATPDSSPLSSSGAAGCGAAHSPLLSWEIRSHERLVIVTVDGELDAYTAPLLGEGLSPIVDTGNHLILDAARVSFCSVAGLRLFLRLQDRAETAGGSLHLATPSPALRRVLDLTRLHHVLATSPDVTSVITTLGHQAIAPPTVGASWWPPRR